MVDYNLKSTVVGESNMYLAPEVEAEKSKVGSAPGNLMEGMTSQYSKPTVGESIYHLESEVEAEKCNLKMKITWGADQELTDFVFLYSNMEAMRGYRL